MAGRCRLSPFGRAIAVPHAVPVGATALAKLPPCDFPRGDLKRDDT